MLTTFVLTRAAALTAVVSQLIVAALGAGCEPHGDTSRAPAPTTAGVPASAAAGTVDDSGTSDAGAHDFSFNVEVVSVAVPQPAVGFHEAFLEVIKTPAPVDNFGVDSEGGIVTAAVAEVNRHGAPMHGIRVDRLSAAGDLEWTRVHLCVLSGPIPSGPRVWFSALAVDAQGNALLGGTFSARCNVAGVELDTAPNPTPRYRSSGPRPYDAPAFRDGILFRQTRDGGSIFVDHFDGPGIQEVTWIVVKPQGGFQVGGIFQGDIRLGGQRYLSPNGGGSPVGFLVDVNAEGRVAGNVVIDTPVPGTPTGHWTPNQETQRVVDQNGNTYSTWRLGVEQTVGSVTLDRGSWVIARNAEGTVRWTRPLVLSDTPPSASVALSGDRLGVEYSTTLFDIEDTEREQECPEQGYVSDLSFLELSLDNDLLREFTITRCRSLAASRIQSHPQGGWMFVANIPADPNHTAVTRGANLVRVPAAE